MIEEFVTRALRMTTTLSPKYVEEIEQVLKKFLVPE